MTPDSPESRIGQLERDAARMDQRITDLTSQVGTLLPLVSGTVRLEGAVSGIKGDIKRLEESVGEAKELIAARDKASTDERRSLRLALFGLTGTIAAAMIAAIATLVAGGVHP